MRAGVVAMLLAMAACVPTPQQQEMALRPQESAVTARQVESRRFDTADQRLMLNAVVGVLQDTGYTLEETNAAHGVVVASRLGGGRVRAQVTLQPSADRTATVVRATFQRIVPRPGAMVPIGQTIREPELYQAFFEKLSQSLFLTSHEI